MSPTTHLPCRAALVAAFLFLQSIAPSGVLGADGPPRVFRCDPGVLAAAREKCLANDPSVTPALAAIRAAAEKAVNGGPFTVTVKKHPLPGVDPHDYVSLAPYYWPDPKSPDGLPYIRRDGERTPELREYDAVPFDEMAKHVDALALGYYLTGDERYADRAAVLLRAWFLDPATRMNPNLNHAQLVKGVNDGRGTGIIESIRLTDVVDSVGMLRGSRAWTADDQAGVEKWFGDYLRWMRESRNGQDEAAAKNNHGSWYDVQEVTFMLFLGDDAGAKQVTEAAKAKRIARQVEPDGQQPLELARTRAFSYSVYNVEALTNLADLAKRVDVDLWNYKTDDGRSIRAAIDWLIPFATGEQAWAHEQINGFDAGGMFVPLRRAEAAYHDGRYEEAIGKLKRADGASERDGLLHPPTR